MGIAVERQRRVTPRLCEISQPSDASMAHLRYLVALHWVLIGICVYLLVFNMPQRSVWICAPLVFVAVLLGRSRGARVWSALRTQRGASSAEHLTAAGKERQPELTKIV